jgi:hypothetical protein
MNVTEVILLKKCSDNRQDMGLYDFMGRFSNVELCRNQLSELLIAATLRNEDLTFIAVQFHDSGRVVVAEYFVSSHRLRLENYGE